MRLPPGLQPARLIARTTRFSALVDDGSRHLPVHVPNSGRLAELLVPGARVWLAPPGWLRAAEGGPMGTAGAPAPMPATAMGGTTTGPQATLVGRNTASMQATDRRRTEADLLLVELPHGPVCVDARLPPLLVAEAVRHSGWCGLPAGEAMREPSWEQGYRLRGQSGHGPSPSGRPRRGRFDLALGGWMIECKSVTLVRQGTAFFPDAPTERGRRHLEEAARIGERAAVVFVIQRGDAVRFAPNHETDPAFATALWDAVRQGVLVLAARCFVSFQEIFLETALPISLLPPGDAVSVD